MSFIQEFGREFGTKPVTVTPRNERPGREVAVFEGQVQALKARFDIDTPIYEGDRLEFDDPRGGRRVVYAVQVKVNEAPSDMPSMAHIAVTFADKPPASPISESRGSGHVIIVNGNHVNVAVEGSTVTQQMPVSEGYEKLVDDVGRALAMIEETAGVDPDEAEAARESAARVIEESTRPAPDQSVIKKLLPTLRAVLTSAATAGAGHAASALVSQLFVH